MLARGMPGGDAGLLSLIANLRSWRSGSHLVRCFAR